MQGDGEDRPDCLEGDYLIADSTGCSNVPINIGKPTFSGFLYKQGVPPSRCARSAPQQARAAWLLSDVARAPRERRRHHGDEQRMESEVLRA